MLQPEKLRYHKLWLFAGLCLVALVGYKSLEPIRIVVEGFEHVDLLLHFVAYLILTGWFQQIYSRNAQLLIAVIVAVYSGILEIAQGFVPLREPNWSDFLTNVSAIILATLINKTAFRNTLKLFEAKYLPA